MAVSGIVGIVHFDGSPIDRRLLERLTAFQAFRGPDRQELWLDHHVGFGHTLLKTTEQSETERQPFSLDGKVWIVADARVDARRDLIAELETHQAEALFNITDVELLLRAYQRWGENCVEHLLGDFAFAIWDGPRQRVFCARDHMGVKPFFYAHVGSIFVFSNTLDCIRQHPAVSERLNDLAIADFLILESNQDPATTSFADIQRLRPAHCFVGSAAGVNVTQYWTMPVDEPIFYRRADDYVDHFKELLRETVSDRIRGCRMGVFMSGGLDSTTLAAVSRDVLYERYTQFDLRAITKTDSADPAEQHYASMVASSLGLSIQYFDDERGELDPDEDPPPYRTSEPGLAPWDFCSYRKLWQLVESHTRVVFFGEGPDNALRFEWRPYVSYLLRQRRYGRLIGDIASTVLAQRRPPFWGGVAMRLRRLRIHEQPYPSSFPTTVSSDLMSRLNLRARWEKKWAGEGYLESAHPIRPQGYASLKIPMWQSVFESLDSANTGALVEVRSPYVDVRMLRFLLAIPPLPWCRSKYLLRRTMRGILPASVLRRKKSGIPCTVRVDRVRSYASTPLVPAPQINAYVNLAHLPSGTSDDIWAVGDGVRVRILNEWLRTSYKVLHNAAKEDPDAIAAE